MSYMPSSFDSFFPTSWVLFPEFESYQATSPALSLPEYLYPLLLFPPLAAYSHSASVGSLYPTTFDGSVVIIPSLSSRFPLLSYALGRFSFSLSQLQYAVAQFQFTSITGLAPLPQPVS